MDKNRNAVESRRDPISAGNEEARRLVVDGDAKILTELELVLVGGGGNDTPLW